MIQQISCIVATVFLLRMHSVKRGLRASGHHGKTQYQKAEEISNALYWKEISKREQEKAGSTKLSRLENKKQKKKKRHCKNIIKSRGVRIKLCFFLLQQYENLILKHK